MCNQHYVAMLFKFLPNRHQKQRIIHCNTFQHLANRFIGVLIIQQTIKIKKLMQNQWIKANTNFFLDFTKKFIDFNSKILRFIFWNFIISSMDILIESNRTVSDEWTMNELALPNEFLRKITAQKFTYFEFLFGILGFCMIDGDTST